MQAIRENGGSGNVQSCRPPTTVAISFDNASYWCTPVWGATDIYIVA